MARRRACLAAVVALGASLLPRHASEAEDVSIPPADDAIIVQAPAVEAVAAGELLGGVALAEDAALRRRLVQAIRWTDAGRDDDAARALGRLAEAAADNDVFVRLEGPGQTLVSLKTEVQRRIGALPPEGEAAYEVMFGPAARRMLDDARADRRIIERVANLYLHTDAGAEGLYRLAALYRDGGAFAEAAACLERLRTERPDAAERFEPHLSIHLAACRLRSGDAAAADEILADLAKGPLAAVLVVAGHEQPSRDLDSLPNISLRELIATEPVQLVSGRSSTPAAGGDAPLAFAGEPFLVPRWSQEMSMTSTGLVGSAIRRRRYEVIPPAFPTVVGDLMLVPIRNGFVVYDVVTGRRLWSYPSISPTASAGERPLSLASRQISSDGRCVFVVESLGRESSPIDQPPVNAFVARQQWGIIPAQAWFGAAADRFPAPSESPATLLTALDVTPPRQGNRLWLVGGPTGEDEPRLAGHTFLGPPLAIHGRLYTIADRDATTRLVVLDASSGRLEWSLDLGQAEIPLAADPERIGIGATPRLMGDVLLCPTAGGAIIAVDLAARSLRWGFRYPRLRPPTALSGDGGGLSSLAETPTWIEPAILAAGRDRVVLTPAESGQLFCLSLDTGELLWQRERAEHLFAAAATAETVLLVGESAALLLGSADGSPVGPPMSFAGGATVTGRGYVGGGGYFQPLSDGSVVRIDLSAGSTTVAASPMRGLRLGNLGWHDGTMFSLGHGFLRAFDDRTSLAFAVASRLSEDADDVAALLRRADLRAADGRYAESIADCRLAHSVAPSPKTRNALVAALLDGLRHGLPDAESYDAELVRLAGP